MSSTLGSKRVDECVGGGWKPNARSAPKKFPRMGNNTPRIPCASEDCHGGYRGPRNQDPALYRRYYPKEIRHQRATHQFFRSCSLQLQFNDSPQRKRPKIAGTQESFWSLPVPLPSSSTCFLQPENFRAATVSHTEVEDITEIEPSDGESLMPNEINKLPSSVEPRPILSAVLNRGLRAKVRSLSSWFLSENDRSRDSLSGWARSDGGPDSMPSSVSFVETTEKKRSWKPSLRFGPFNRRKRPREQCEDSVLSDQAPSTASLNSLSDGRTPWPIPWLEAIFLPEYPNKSPVNEKSFVVVGSIASGAFGKVYRVCLKSQPKAVFAMKVQSKSDIIAQNAVQQMKDEVSIHESVGQCSFIAQLYASWQSRTKLYTVLQYATGYGDLYELFRDFGPLGFQDPVVQIYAAEIALALDFLHSSGVVYRDLKLENVVLDDQGHVQLVDFGLAKWMGMGDRTKTICGTLDYMAPEIAAQTAYDHAVDWWSLGVLVFILLTGSRPFPSAPTHHSLQFHSRSSSQLIGPAAQELIDRLLCLDPEERLRSLVHLQQLQYFANLDFDRVADKQIHPFDFIPRMRRCNSCNMDEDLETTMERGDISGFQEEYQQFSEFDYFHENV